MALSPELEIVELDETEQPTLRTFRYDFEKKRITNEMIEGIEAAKQYIYIALKTPRFAYPIFSDNFGNEAEEMLSDNETTIAYKKMELPRLIKESLIYLFFVDDVHSFKVEHIEDAFHTSFIVDTIFGNFGMEEVF